MKSALISALAYTIMLMAPLPSAYFVAVSAQSHFSSPLVMAIIIAVVIEGLGFICAHVALKYWQWNRHTRIKKIERSWLEFVLSLLMYAVYFTATIGLLAVLDVMPQLNAWSKVMFPILSAVGVVNLALLIQLESMKGEKGAVNTVKKMTVIDNKLTLNDDSILTLFRDNPRVSLRAAGKSLGTSHETIRQRLVGMETEGRIKRNGHGVEVIE